MIARSALIARIRTALGRSPVTVLVGPRQCGKTTLAGIVGTGRSAVTRFDLEHPADLLALEHPVEALGQHRGLVFVDGGQRRPDLFRPGSFCSGALPPTCSARARNPWPAASRSSRWAGSTSLRWAPAPLSD